MIEHATRAWTGLNRGRTRQVLILTGAAGVCIIIGTFLYAMSMSAVTPTNPPEGGMKGALDTRRITIGGVSVAVDVANTEASREQGLSGRKGLGENEGMLFVFPRDGIYSFWMKDMLFSIDMVWIGATGTIVHIESDVSPKTYPKAFTPSANARYVLELPAGWCAAHRVKAGDNVAL